MLSIPPSFRFLKLNLDSLGENNNISIIIITPIWKGKYGDKTRAEAPRGSVTKEK